VIPPLAALARGVQPEVKVRVEQVTGPVAFHGEGPVWSAAWGGLRFVDMLAGSVLSVAADGSVGRHQVGAIAAALRPRRGGGAVIGVPAVAVAGAVAVMLAYPLTESAVRSLVGELAARRRSEVF
jgi:hypothetical protein